MTKEKKEETKQQSIRFPLVLLNKIRARAKKNKRSFGSEVIKIVEDQLLLENN